MTLIQELMNQTAVDGVFNFQTIRAFSPAEIRETIQHLVATEQLDLANALGDAGLSLYPHSVDILAITSLLAMTNQDWSLAVELLDELILLQGDATPAFTFVLMVRVLRCNLEPHRALAVAKHGLAWYPEHAELLNEEQALSHFSDSLLPTNERQH